MIRRTRAPASQRVGILDFGFCILHSAILHCAGGACKLDPSRPNLDQSRINLRRGILDFGFWILDSGFWILDSGFWILDFGFWIWILDFFFKGRAGRSLLHEHTLRRAYTAG